jgi:hypothetical protein
VEIRDLIVHPSLQRGSVNAKNPLMTGLKVATAGAFGVVRRFRNIAWLVVLNQSAENKTQGGT